MTISISLRAVQFLAFFQWILTRTVWTCNVCALYIYIFLLSFFCCFFLYVSRMHRVFKLGFIIKSLLKTIRNELMFSKRCRIPNQSALSNAYVHLIDQFSRIVRMQNICNLHFVNISWEKCKDHNDKTLLNWTKFQLILQSTKSVYWKYIIMQNNWH